MFEDVFDFVKRHSSLIITTHDFVDADGLGAEIAFTQICRDMGKKCMILNSKPMPNRLVFMDPMNDVDIWDKTNGKYDFLYDERKKKPAMVILDSSDEYNIGMMKELIPLAEEVFIIDHHEAAIPSLQGFRDSSASSTSELMVEIAAAWGITLNPVSSAALYAGIIYDTGSFAYSKTTARTFKAALSLVEAGVNPYKIYHELYECAPKGALLLHKQVLSTLEIHNKGRVAVQILRKEALESSNAHIEDADSFVNDPLKAKDIVVSLLVKENPEGQIRCSLRSKGTVNVSKIAQTFGGGGHVAASGFRSALGIEDTLSRVLEEITVALEKIP